MRSILFMIAVFVAASVAAPSIFDDVYDLSDELADFYFKVSRHIYRAGRKFGHRATCDTSKIALPDFASDLPSPSGQQPLYVGIGRGTQNYSCATSTFDTAPVAVGALATLYNATCIAADYPDLLSQIPDMAYHIPLQRNLMVPVPQVNIRILGHHFFQGHVPVFNLDTTPGRQLGIARTKLGSKINAPSNALSGDNGAVSWLYLSTLNGTVGGFSSVYRVNTAGGKPPQTCEGMSSLFQVQYAALYYFFGH